MNRSKVAAAILFSSVSAMSGCGKDETDFDSLKDEIGIINGSFNMRIAAHYREKMDALQAKLDDVVPGASSLLLARFDDDPNGDAGGGVKFSDLVKINIPGTESKFANQFMFSELKNLAGENGPYFDLVDNDKYVKKPYYVPSTGADKDPKIGEQYYLEMIRWQQGVNLISHPMLSAAVPVVVAVLDTGVNAAHPDLAKVMWKNASADVGYNGATKTVIGVSTSNDVNGHGTHVAGIIAAAGNNKYGIHGVAGIPKAGGTQYLAEIMNVKVLNDNGAGSSNGIANGIKWAVDQHKKQKASNNSRAKQKLILNMSLGGPFDASEFEFQKVDGKPVFEDDLINYAASNDDVLVVVAAGNDTCGIGSYCDLYGDAYYQAYYYPCSYKNVLCVAATTHKDELAGFSNRRESVGIAAPGYQIVSTSAAGGDEYVYYSGTSQATPVTSGAAAVVWSVYPEFTGNQIKAILRKTAAKIATVSAEVSSGDGRLNLEAALRFAEWAKANGKDPEVVDPDPAILNNDVVTPGTEPAAGTLGPNDPSPNSKPGEGPASKGKGSAQGCAVVGSDAAGSGWMVLLAALIAPLVMRRREA